MERGSLLLLLVAMLTVACRDTPFGIGKEDARRATATVVGDFLSRDGGLGWPEIFLSDEYLAFPLDSSFVRLLPEVGAPIEFAHRAQVELSPDIIRDGALLIEASRAQPEADGSLTLRLSFSANSGFGGEFEYRLTRWRSPDWRVVSITVIWTV